VISLVLTYEQSLNAFSNQVWLKTDGYRIDNNGSDSSMISIMLKLGTLCDINGTRSMPRTVIKCIMQVYLLASRWLQAWQ
jgi:hypothetical protein